MPKIEEHNGKKYWINAEGDRIPEKRVFKHEKRADRLVTKLLKRAIRLSEYTEKEKTYLIGEIRKYLEELAKINKTTKINGNVTIYDFAGDNAIEQTLSKNLIMDDRIAAAKQKIDDLILEWTEGSSDKVIALIQNAFKLNRNGEMNVKELMGLKNIDIKDPGWKEAVQLVIDSIKVGTRKLYWNFKTKDEDGKLKTIPLNFSSF